MCGATPIGRRPEYPPRRFWPVDGLDDIGCSAIFCSSVVILRSSEPA